MENTDCRGHGMDTAGQTVARRGVQLPRECSKPSPHTSPATPAPISPCTAAPPSPAVSLPPPPEQSWQQPQGRGCPVPHQYRAQCLLTHVISAAVVAQGPVRTGCVQSSAWLRVCVGAVVLQRDLGVGWSLWGWEEPPCGLGLACRALGVKSSPRKQHLYTWPFRTSAAHLGPESRPGRTTL